MDAEYAINVQFLAREMLLRQRVTLPSHFVFTLNINKKKQAKQQQQNPHSYYFLGSLYEEWKRCNVKYYIMWILPACTTWVRAGKQCLIRVYLVVWVNPYDPSDILYCHSWIPDTVSDHNCFDPFVHIAYEYLNCPDTCCRFLWDTTHWLPLLGKLNIYSYTVFYFFLPVIYTYEVLSCHAIAAWSL